MKRITGQKTYQGRALNNDQLRQIGGYVWTKANRAEAAKAALRAQKAERGAAMRAEVEAELRTQRQARAERRRQARRPLWLVALGAWAATVYTARTIRAAWNEFWTQARQLAAVLALMTFALLLTLMVLSVALRETPAAKPSTQSRVESVLQRQREAIHRPTPQAKPRAKTLRGAEPNESREG